MSKEPGKVYIKQENGEERGLTVEQFEQHIAANPSPVVRIVRKVGLTAEAEAWLESLEIK